MAVDTYSETKNKKWTDLSFLRETFTQIGCSFDDGFCVDQENREVIDEVLKYFFTPYKTNLNPIKGLLIYGKVGSGKTMIFQIVNRMLSMRSEAFKFIRCQDVIEQFQIHGERTLRAYCQNVDTFFDDIGEEVSDQKRFGNQSNPIQMIMSKRYQIFQNAKIRTFGTTNLTAIQIRERYGLRIESRFDEMFNVLGLGTSEGYTDRRKMAKPAAVKSEHNQLEKEDLKVDHYGFMKSMFIPHYEKYIENGEWSFPEFSYRYYFRLLYQANLIKLTNEEILDIRKESAQRVLATPLNDVMRTQLREQMKSNTFSGVIGEKVNRKAAEICLRKFVTSKEFTSDQILEAFL